MEELEGFIENEQELEGEVDIEFSPIPEIEIGKVETVEYTDDALVAIDSESTKLKRIFNFYLPKGKDGEDGVDGKDGENGADGTDGVDGKDYIIEEKDYIEIGNIVEGNIQPILESNLKSAKDYTDNAIVRDFKDISFNETTMTFIFTRHDNTTLTVDLPIEQTVKNGRYDADTQELVLILVSGQEIKIPASGLIDDYDGVNTATIQCVVSSDNKISCNIIAGSISKTLLTADLQAELNDKIGSTEFNQKMNEKVNTETFNQELAKKLNSADVTERAFEITYEDGTTDEIRSVIFK